jgi:hypothetical protein
LRAPVTFDQFQQGLRATLERHASMPS